MSTIAVVMDANVLVPAALCDFLLRAASKDIYRLVWTEDLLEEVRRTLINDLGRSEALANKRIEAMKDAFPEALVTQHTPLIPAMTNDPKDRLSWPQQSYQALRLSLPAILLIFRPNRFRPFLLKHNHPIDF